MGLRADRLVAPPRKRGSLGELAWLNVTLDFDGARIKDTLPTCASEVYDYLDARTPARVHLQEYT